MANFGANSVSVLLGNGDAAFQARRDFGTGSGPSAIAIANLNGDSQPDLAVANSGSNTVSVLLNTIGGVPTAALLSLFQGSWTSAGVELRWQFGVPGSFIAAELERSDAAAGPWAAVNGERHDEGETAILLDRSVESRRSYYYRLAVTRRGGGVTTFGPLVVTAGETVSKFALLLVAPSPSRGVVRIEFTVGRETRVRLGVLDVQGRVTALLADGVYQPGLYQAAWDGRSEVGTSPAGIYFVRYEAAGKNSVRRFLLVR